MAVHVRFEAGLQRLEQPVALRSGNLFGFGHLYRWFVRGVSDVRGAPPNAQVHLPGGAGADDSRKTYRPAGSGAAPGSASVASRVRTIDRAHCSTRPAYPSTPPASTSATVIGHPETRHRTTASPAPPRPRPGAS